MLDPVALSVGPVHVYWYGIIMAAAFLLGLWLSELEARRLGFPKGLIVDLAVWVIPASIIGARLYYVVFHLAEYTSNPWDILAVWKGGLAIHGGLLGGLLAVLWFAKSRGISFLWLADILVPSVLLGQALGRWGNFINQEAFGSVVDKATLQALYLPDFIINQMNIQGVWHHPTFLYESVWDLLGVILLLALRYFNPKRGEIFFVYLLWYSLGRFFIEGLRTDSLAFTGPQWLSDLLSWLWSPMAGYVAPGFLLGGNIRVAQLVSVLLILLSLGAIIWRRRSKATPDYQSIKPTIQTPDLV